MGKRGLIIVFIILFFGVSFVSASNVGLIEDTVWQGNLTGSNTGNGAVLGDIDGDGDLDLISIGCTKTINPCNNNPDKPRVFTNNGSSFIENSTWQQELIGVSGSIALGDIDNDGDLDLVLAGSSSGNTSIYTNNGTSFVENSTWQQKVVADDTGSGSVALGDIDNDGDLDLLFPDAGTPGELIYINNGTSFVSNQAWEGDITDNGKISLGLIDLDNDNDLDLHIIGQDSSKGYENNGSAFATKGDWNSFTADEGSVAWGDFDNDGDFDHVITSGSTSILINDINTTGEFTDGTTQWDFDLSLYAFGSSMFGDYDNDGDLDLVLLGGGVEVQIRFILQIIMEHFLLKM